jgi:hypothetical protein
MSTIQVAFDTSNDARYVAAAIIAKIATDTAPAMAGSARRAADTRELRMIAIATRIIQEANRNDAASA